MSSKLCAGLVVAGLVVGGVFLRGATSTLAAGDDQAGNAATNADPNAPAAPAEAQTAPPAPPQPPTPPDNILIGISGLNVYTRSTTENTFSDTTKKWGVELLRDPYTGGTVYMTEAGSIAAMSSRPSFTIETLALAPNTRPEMLRVNNITGETWMMSGDAGWKKLAEGGWPIFRGDYQVILAAGSNNSFYAYRMDRVTGRSWVLNAGTWGDVPEPQP